MSFVLTLAWRESRASRRRGLLLVLAVAIGTAALVAINSFTDNLRESVGREARALLGADLALSSASPFSPAAEALLAEVQRATVPAGRGRARRELRRDGPAAGRRDDTARPGAGRRSRLPLLRRHRDLPRRRVAAPRRDGRGRRRRFAARRSRRPDRRRDRPRRGALRPARHPRERARGRGPRQRTRAARPHPPHPRRRDLPADARLARPLRGVPAPAARRRRPEDRRPLPLPALRGAPERPHGLGRPAGPHPDPVALRQLPGPRGARGAPPRRPRRRERGARPHQAPHGHRGRPALPRRFRRHRPRRVPRPGGARGPRSAASWARQSGRRSSWRSRAC